MTSFSSDREANPLEKEVTVAISPFFFFGSLSERERVCVREREKKEWSESGKRDEAARERVRRKSKKGKINNGITVRLKSFVIYPNI